MKCLKCYTDNPSETKALGILEGDNCINKQKTLSYWPVAEIEEAGEKSGKLCRAI